MSISWYRDLAIAIAGLGFTALLLITAILALFLFLRIMAILNSTKKTVATVKAMATFISEEVAQPLVQIAAVAVILRQGIELFTGSTKR